MYLKIFSKSGALWVVLLAVCVARRKALTWGKFASGAGLVVLPSVAALVMYSLVLVEFRYVAPFALMLMLWMLARMRIVMGADPQLLRRFHLAVKLATALTVFGSNWFALAVGVVFGVGAWRVAVFGPPE